jgi:hypothetical protein
MSTIDRALERVQDLYIAQMKLLDLLESDLSSPDVRKEVRSHMKQFETLLARADWRYMGGMDVWETLQALPTEMMKRLRTSSVSVQKSRMGTKKTKPAKAQKSQTKTRKLNKAPRFAKGKKKK